MSSHQARGGASRHLLSTLIHRTIVIQKQPALDDTIDNPDNVRHKHEPTHDHQGRNDAQHPPQQPKPKRANLPAKVTFQKRSSNVAIFHIIDHDRHDCGNQQQERRCLKRVDNHGQRLCGFLHIGCCHHFHLSAPFTMRYFMGTTAIPRSDETIS
jgi:hypothetical protein